MAKSGATPRVLPSSPFKAPVAPPLKRFELGNRVTHDRYGLGRVIGVEDTSAVLVDFGTRQVRITSPFHGMTVL